MAINFNKLNEQEEINQPLVKRDPLDPAPLLNLFDKFHAEIDKMESTVADVEVKDNETCEQATIYSTQAKKITQVIEAKRKEVKEPYLKVISVLDSEVKELKDRLKDIQVGLNEKITPYLQEQERVRREKEMEARRKAAEEQEKIRKQLEDEAKQRAKDEQERLNKELGDKAPIVEVEQVIVPEVVAPIQPELKIKTSSGSVKLETKTEWEIIDFKALPDVVFEMRKDEITKAMATQINAMIKSGLTNIPGVRIFETVKSKTTTKRR